MIENEDTIVVFTARSPERIVSEGGSGAWVLDAARAKQCKWLVCTQNRHNRNHEFYDATEPHGSAFLLGKIAAVVPSQAEGFEHRWMIAIDEFARIERPGVWRGDRNPVRYTSLLELGISPDGLEFQPMPAATKEGRAPSESQVPPGRTGLTIAQARNGLAATFGVKPEAVEITIRG